MYWEKELDIPDSDIHRRIRKVKTWEDFERLDREHDKIVEKSGGFYKHDTPVMFKTGSYVTNSVFYSIGYWGSSGYLSEWLPRYIKRHCGKVETFIECPSGGSSLAYGVRRLQHFPQTISNDRGFWNFCGAHMLLVNSKKVNEKAILSRVEPTKGYCSENIDFFRPDTAAWIDGYCSEHYKNKNFAALSLLGTVFAKKLSFRQLQFDKKLCRSIRVGYLKDRLERAVYWVNRYLPIEGKGIAYCSDFQTFVDYKLMKTPKSVMFMDFAWPWNTGKPVTEYDFCLQISDMLRQRRGTNRNFWTTQTLYANLKSILSSAFKKVSYIIVNTQDSNWPPPVELKNFLEEHFPKRLQHISLCDSESGWKESGSVRDYFYLMKGDVG